MKNNLLSILIIVAFTLLGKFAYAQDIHFSQFYASPLSLNPANTGNYTGDWRVMGNYRKQWTALNQPYITKSIGYDRPFYYFNEKFSGGFYFVNDESGGANLNVNKIFVSGAYHRNINYNVFHIGIQTGLVMKGYDIDKLTFSSQKDMSTSGGSGSPLYNSNFPSNETLDENHSYFDMNLGVSWNRKFAKMEPKVGVSFFHLNNPKEYFSSKKDNLPVRKVIDAEVKIDILSSVFVRPRLLYMGHKKATDAIIGSDFGYNFPENSIDAENVFIGSYFRHNFSSNPDAFFIVFGFGIKSIDFGFSYDVNISDLNPYTTGTFEFSIIYRGISTVLNKISIPCDRY